MARTVNVAELEQRFPHLRDESAPCAACGARWRPLDPIHPTSPREIHHERGCAYIAEIDKEDDEDA